MFAFFERLAPTVIAIEACGASHHYARRLQSFGHTVKLIAPQLVKPYLKRGKNDAADAEALCEAMSRPTMRFVPVKTAEQQAALMLVGVRDRLARIIHRGWAELREAVRRSVVFGGVEDADNRGLKLRRGVCSGASGPVVYGGSLAIRPARLAKLVW